MITYLTSRGLSDAQIQPISGHESKKILEIYQHLAVGAYSRKPKNRCGSPAVQEASRVWNRHAFRESDLTSRKAVESAASGQPIRDRPQQRQGPTAFVEAIGADRPRLGIQGIKEQAIRGQSGVYGRGVGPGGTDVNKAQLPSFRYREERLGAGTGIRYHAGLPIPGHDVPAGRRALRRHRAANELQRAVLCDGLRGRRRAAVGPASEFGDDQNTGGRKGA